MRSPDEYRQAMHQRLKERNLTVAQVAERVPFTRRTVSSALDGTSNGSLTLWLHLLDAVGLDLVVMDRRGD